MSNSSCCIYGAGAIGLDLTWQLVRSGHAVTVIARGERRETLERQGIRHLGFPGEKIAPSGFRIASSSEEAGPHRYIFLAVRVESLVDIAPDIRGLVTPQSLIISATNGIPPWFFHLQEETLARFTLPAEARLKFLEDVPGEQIVGAIVERTAVLSSPSTIQSANGKGFVIGELHHGDSARCQATAKLLTSAGLSTTQTQNIHRDIWLRMIPNIALNPLSLLTEQTAAKLLANEKSAQRIRRLAQETAKVGIRLGVLRPHDFREEHLLQTAQQKLHDQRTWMLHDFLRGKQLEVHRTIEAVEQLARAPGPTPVIETPALRELDKELRQRMVGNLTHTN